MGETKRIYRVNSSDPRELNLILAQISDRLDQIEGYRGNPVIRSDATLQESKLEHKDSTGTVLHSIGGE